MCRLVLGQSSLDAAVGESTVSRMRDACRARAKDIGAACYWLANAALLVAALDPNREPLLLTPHPAIPPNIPPVVIKARALLGDAYRAVAETCCRQVKPLVSQVAERKGSVKPLLAALTALLNDMEGVSLLTFLCGVVDFVLVNLS